MNLAVGKSLRSQESYHLMAEKIMQASLEQLKNEGYEINDEDMKYLSPVGSFRQDISRYVSPFAVFVFEKDDARITNRRAVAVNYAD